MEGCKMRVPLLLVLHVVFVHSVKQELLYIRSSCSMSYQIKDMYDVTIKDLGQVCPNGSIISTNHRTPVNHNIYHLNIKITSDGRDIEIDWEQPSCYQEYYILIEVNFHPDWILNDAQRRCLHVTVTRLSNEWLYGKSRRINLKCLAVRSRNIGTLTIINNRHVHDNNCGKKSSVSEATTFDLGCRINQTSITVDSCLTMEFWKLSRHFDFKRSEIMVYWENICMHVFDASLTVRYSDPMKLILPVYRNGTYYIKATLACNASGEIEQNSLSLQKTVSNAESCGNFQPNLSSKCEDVKPKVGKVTILPPKKPLTQIYTIITVISVLVTVVTVVTVAFIHKQRTISNRKRRSGEIGNPVEGEGLVFDTSL